MSITEKHVVAHFIERLVYAIVGPSRSERSAESKKTDKYEGAMHTRINPQRRDPGSADAQTAPAGPQLRDNSRNLDDNYDLAAGVLNTLCAKCIGTGLKPEPMVRLNNGDPATQFNRDLVELWEEWSERCDVTRTMSEFQAEDLAFRTWCRDGEVFDQVFMGDVRGLQHGPAGIPLSIEVLEPDYFPFDYNDPSKNIVQAVQKSGWGRPTGYYKWRYHPGDIASPSATFTSQTIGRLGSYTDTRRIPAERILHTKQPNPKRLHMTRGVSVMTPIMNRFRGVKGYDESENVAAQVAAASCFAIKTHAPADFEPAPDAADRPVTPMEPGTGLRLQVGEDVTMIAANRPNPELTNYRNSQLRGVAAGVGTAFSTIARLYDESYSAMRQELVDTQINYARMTKGYSDMRKKPLWRRYVIAVTLSRLRIPRNVDRSTLFRVMIIPPTTPWIDPKKEIEADILALTGGESGMPLDSWSNIVRKRHGNPNELIEQIAEQRELFQNLTPETDNGESDETNPGASESQAA